MKYRLILTACSFALLVSCMPKLYPPQVEVPEDYLYAEGFIRDTAPLNLRWWELFDDPTLDTLVETALRNNRDLLSAASRIEQARDQLAVARAAFLPAIGLDISAEGDYTSQTKIIQQYAIEPQLSWEVSLFGAMRNTKRAARAAILSSEWAYRGVMLSLAAEVATTYFTLRQYDRNLEIAQSSFRLRRESAALIDSLFYYGMSDGVALQQARSLVYSTAADIPQYERAIVQTRLSLCTLLGLNPETTDFSALSPELSPDSLSFDIPVGLPSALLERRPDVMQSYYAMQQAAFEVGIARSARYPSITLTGKGGVMSSTIQGLSSGEPWAWSALGSITQPIFAFGQLRRKEQAAKEHYMQSLFTYEQTILGAFSDVEGALIEIDTYHAQLHRYEELVTANRRITEMTQALYDSGMSDYLSVIDAQRELYDSQMELSNVAIEQYLACIALCKALGGGW